jgi:hypothetical protein
LDFILSESLQKSAGNWPRVVGLKRPPGSVGFGLRSGVGVGRFSLERHDAGRHGGQGGFLRRTSLGELPPADTGPGFGYRLLGDYSGVHRHWRG